MAGLTMTAKEKLPGQRQDLSHPAQVAQSEEAHPLIPFSHLWSMWGVLVCPLAPNLDMCHRL